NITTAAIDIIPNDSSDDADSQEDKEERARHAIIFQEPMASLPSMEEVKEWTRAQFFNTTFLDFSDKRSRPNKAGTNAPPEASKSPTKTKKTSSAVLSVHDFLNDFFNKTLQEA
ncbi:unnamed protein product, partial [Amoebophrya sp. A120]